MGVPPFFGLLMFVDVVEYDGRFFFKTIPVHLGFRPVRSRWPPGGCRQASHQEGRMVFHQRK